MKLYKLSGKTKNG